MVISAFETARWSVVYLAALLVPVVLACEDPVTSADWSATLERGVAAYARLDESAFRAAFSEAVTQIPCLADETPPATIAAWHRLNALRWYLDAEDPAAALSLRAMLKAQAGETLSDDLAPPGNPLYVLLIQAQRTGPGLQQRMPPAPTGTLLVDGRVTASRHLELPELVQLITRDGDALYSTALAPGELEPDWPPVLDPRNGQRRLTVHRPLAWASLATATAGLGLYGVAYGMSLRYDRLDADGVTTRSQLDGLRLRTNAVAGTGVGALSVAGALGVGAFVFPNGAGLRAGATW